MAKFLITLNLEVRLAEKHTLCQCYYRMALWFY